MALSAFTGTVSKDDEKEKKNADKRRFENDLIALQSDQKKSEKKVENLELDLRVLQKKYTAIGFEIKDKQEEMKKSQSDMQFLEEEVRVLKKKINNL